MASPKRVLVIDKNSDIRQLIEILVRKLGYDASVVPGVAEAKRVLQAREFDSIICDLCANESECENLVQLVHETNPEFPFVLFTESKGFLPPGLRNDNCFSVARFDFKDMQRVLKTLFAETESSQQPSQE